MSFLCQFLESHGDAVVEALSRHLELSREEAERIITATVPLVLGGLARQAQSKGPDAVAQILKVHADASALTDTPAFLDRQAQSPDPLGGLGSLLGGGLLAKGALAHLFGGSIAKIATGALASFLNLDAPQAAKVLPMLLPLIMASLHQRAAGDEIVGLPEVLRLLAEEGNPGALEELAGKVLTGGGPLGSLPRGG